MAKLSLNNITSGFASNTALNANFDAIEAALENTVSRDGTTPNQMTADLDMNGHRILNALADSGDGFVYEGGWTTSTAYTTNDLVYIPVGTGSSYDGFTLICKVAHTSGTLNTDYAAGKWGIIAARGASGSGSGDLVSTSNLSDVANATTARGNLSAAKSGANSDITSLSALSTALSVAQGGTGGTTQAAALATLGAALNGVLSKSAAYSVVVEDRGKLIDATTGTWVLSLPNAATAGDGFVIALRNSGTGSITPTPVVPELIDNVASLSFNAGESGFIVCNGTGWKTISRGGGGPLQVVFGTTSNLVTGTSSIPMDDSVPQQTEGVEVLTVSITPKSSTSYLLVEATSFAAHSTNSDITFALFRDTTSGAIAATMGTPSASDKCQEGHLVARVSSGSIASTTFKLRIGSNGAGTLSVNGRAGARLFGGVAATTITITEIPG